MSKIHDFSLLSPSIPFTEYDFYHLYNETFRHSELGRIRSILPLREMAVSFGLVKTSRRLNRGQKPYFSPEGKVALMFLKMYTQLSAPKLLEQLNGNIHYQLFCGITIDPLHPLKSYKLIDSIISELAGKLRLQEQQKILADMWKPYMKDLETMYTDSTCNESDMRYPTDPKLVWEGIEKPYVLMCRLSSELGIHRPRTKYNDVSKANMAYRKQRKHSRNQTRKILRRLLCLLGKGV